MYHVNWKTNQQASFKYFVKSISISKTLLAKVSSIQTTISKENLSINGLKAKS